MEKVVKCPQAENSQIYNLLKIVCLTTKDKQKYVYQLLVLHDEILKFWLPILNSQPSNLNFELSFFSSPYLYSPWSNLNLLFFLIPQSKVQDIWLKIFSK